jgi:hypothetical protein
MSHRRRPSPSASNLDAEFDGLSAKFDALELKVVGSVKKQLQSTVKRIETREILGEKTLQEIVLK